jgi:type II secretory pathway pseudopilin PulG
MASQLRFLQRGFTFIELLVVLTIVILTSTGGVVSYRTFNQRQQLIQSGKQLYQSLRIAQTKAQVGEKPDVCAANGVTAYGITGSSGGRTIVTQAHCGSAQTTSSLPLDDSVAFSSSFDVRFMTLYGGVNSSSPVVIRLVHAASAKQYQVTVTPGGGISDDGIQP